MALTLATWVLWICLAGGAMMSGASHVEAGRSFWATYPWNALGLLVVAVPGALATWFVNRRSSVSLTTETATLLEAIPEADIRFEAADVKLRLSSVGLGFAIEWSRADVVVTRHHILLLTYNGTFGSRFSQPPLQICLGSDRVAVSPRTRVHRLKTSAALTPDGDVTISVEPTQPGVARRTMTLSAMDGAAFLDAIRRGST
jgi:hypothetical protein